MNFLRVGSGFAFSVAWYCKASLKAASLASVPPAIVSDVFEALLRRLTRGVEDSFAHFTICCIDQKACECFCNICVEHHRGYIRKATLQSLDHRLLDACVQMPNARHGSTTRCIQYVPAVLQMECLR